MEELKISNPPMGNQIPPRSGSANDEPFMLPTILNDETILEPMKITPPIGDQLSNDENAPFPICSTDMNDETILEPMKITNPPIGDQLSNDENAPFPIRSTDMNDETILEPMKITPPIGDQLSNDENAPFPIRSTDMNDETILEPMKITNPPIGDQLSNDENAPFPIRSTDMNDETILEPMKITNPPIGDQLSNDKNAPCPIRSTDMNDETIFEPMEITNPPIGHQLSNDEVIEACNSPIGNQIYGVHQAVDIRSSKSTHKSPKPLLECIEDNTLPQGRDHSIVNIDLKDDLSINPIRPQNDYVDDGFKNDNRRNSKLENWVQQSYNSDSANESREAILDVKVDNSLPQGRNELENVLDVDVKDDLSQSQVYPENRCVDDDDNRQSDDLENYEQQQYQQEHNHQNQNQNCDDLKNNQNLKEDGKEPNADVIDYEPIEGLEDAVESEDVDVVRGLLRGTVPEFRERKQAFIDALFIVCDRGKVEVVKVLLEGSNPSFREIKKHNVTPLWIASYYGHLEIVKVLLQGCDETLREKSAEGEPPLIAAIWNRHEDVVRTLLDGTSPNYREIPDMTKRTPLYYASKFGQLNVVKMLLTTSDNEPILDVDASDPPRTESERTIKNDESSILIEVGNLPMTETTTTPTTTVPKYTQMEMEPLRAAVENDHIEIAGLLLEGKRHEYRESLDFYERTPLFLACQRNNLEMVQLLLKDSESEYREIGSEHCTPLSLTVDKGYIRIADELQKGDRSSSMGQNKKFTPLIRAVHLRETEKIEELIKKDPKWTENPGIHKETPLYTACTDGYEDVVEILLKYSDPEYREKINMYDRTALWIACNFGYVGIVALVLNGSTEELREISDSYGSTALLAACRHSFKDADGEFINKQEYIDIVRLLLDGSRLEYREMPNDYGETPLSAAVMHGHVQIVELLLDGSNPEYREGEIAGKSLFMWAYESNNVKMMRMLLNGSRIDYRDHTVLMKACEDENIEMVNALVETDELCSNGKFEREMFDEYGFTPLMKASRYGFLEVVKSLLKRARPEYKAMFSEKWATPLSAAVRNNHLEVVRVFLEGTSPEYREIPDWDDVTPLMQACIDNNIRMVKMLLNGARSGYEEIKCKKYGTPLEFTRKEGFDEIHKLLKK
eukprot:TRINITY_DN454_c0_g1_i2.p1 TRINITY_DN454_c0_g1~~TRINITY_DN454_c0_g1_i2.p1  ORF type:complete len:1134 (+),score=270.29 TRINITY_DN454_c0_g1_i2:247-3648(+)